MTTRKSPIDEPPEKLPRFLRATPTPDDLLLIAVVVLGARPNGNLMTWTHHTLSASCKYWTKPYHGIQTWIMPYYPVVTAAVFEALRIKKTDQNLFDLMIGKAHAVLPDLVLERAKNKDWRQKPSQLAFKYFHNRMYKLWMVGKCEYPDTQAIVEVIGWKSKDPFVPQSIIPWEDFQSGQWKSQLENLDWEKLSSELP